MTQIIIMRGKSFQASMRSIAIVICLSLLHGPNNEGDYGDDEDAEDQ